MKRTTTCCFLIAVISAVLLCEACTSISKKDNPDFLGDYPPQFLGRMRLNVVKRYSDTLLPRDISFIFEPQINTVKFHHKLLGDNIWIYLTKDNRVALQQAIKQYLTAFDEKNLTPEGAKKKSAFGKTDVFMTWGLVGAAHEAVPTLRFDYQFITPQRPYFILANATVQSVDGANCPAIRIAISPAQCKDILKILDEQSLLNLVAELKIEYEKFDEHTTNSAAISDIENSSEEPNTPSKEDISFDDF